MRRAGWWWLLVLAGCARGCPANSCAGGGPATECASDKDCEGTERCRDHYCQTPESSSSSDRCLETPECKGWGACRAGLTRSFLGANSKPTCLVERDEDCAASTLCKTQGRCALAWTTGAYRDGYCTANTPKHCSSSTRCASHDECTYDARGVCGRSWSNCTGDKLRGFEASANLGAPWQPGDVADATLACRIEDSYQQKTSFVRVAGTCVRGPTLGSNTPFLLRTKLAVKDRVEVAIQADPKLGTYRDAGYVRAEYTGSSRFSSGTSTELPKLTCDVVPPDAAKANAAGMVARIEKGLVRLSRERLSPEHLIAEPAEAGGIRRVLAEAASWLGSDPQIAKLQAALEAGLVPWRAQLDAAISKLVPSEAGPKGSTLRLEGYVCGDALKKRTNRDDLGADACGVEIVVRATELMQLGTGFHDFYTLSIVRPGLQATVIDAQIVDVHSQTKPALATSFALDPGDEATVLIVPKQFLPLAGTRLIGAVSPGSKTRFVLPLDR